VTPSLLLWTLSWAPSLAGCDGTPLLYPEQVVYVVPYVRMAMVESEDCPLDELGRVQACAMPVEWNQWDIGAATSFSSDSIPTPPVGSVYDVQMPIAENPAGRCVP